MSIPSADNASAEELSISRLPDANNAKEALGITEDVPIALSARMYEALVPYVAPRLHTSEVTLHEGGHAQSACLEGLQKLLSNLRNAEVLASRPALDNAESRG